MVTVKPVMQCKTARAVSVSIDCKAPLEYADFREQGKPIERVSRRKDVGMRSRTIVLLTGFLGLLGITMTPLCGQIVTGSIVGSVQDPSGLAVPGANVTLTSVSTGMSREVSTNAQGSFEFLGLDAGEYKLVVSSEGFKTVERTGIRLATGERLPIGTVVMEIGAVTETVSVTARPAAVMTESSERADVVTGTQVDELLNLGRNVTALVSLMPGVVVTRDQAELGRRTDFNVLGNRRRANNVSIDGIPAVDIDNGFAKKLTVSQDSVAEVKVMMSNYQAEYGRMAGSNVQIVTKSGTKEFHGLLSYFKRHEQFNANNFFNNRNRAAKPRYRYNTYTYNVGGPVYLPGKFNTSKDKLFFFWGQEFWPSKVGQVRRITMPTELERAGNFSQSLDVNDKLIVVNDPLTGSPFPGNLVPESRIDPSGQALLRFFDKPNFFDRTISKGAYNYVFSSENDQPRRTDTLKIDYNLNSTNKIVGTYSGYFENYEGFIGFPTGTGNWPQMRKTFNGATHGVAGRWTRIIRPNVINEFHMGWLHHPEKNTYTDEQLKRNQRDTVGFVAPMLSPESNPLQLIPNARFGGIPNAGQLNIEGRFPFDAINNVLNWDDKLSVISGNHSFKAGVYAEWFQRDMAVQGSLFNGDVRFDRDVNNPLDTNYAYANAILGVFRTYSEANRRPRMHARGYVVEGFLQDKWKVTPRLTLDYGVRMYWHPPMYDRDGQISGFSPDRYDPARAVQLIRPGRDAQGKRVGLHPVTGEIYPSNLIGAIAPGIGDPFNGMVVPAEATDYPRGLVKSRGVQWAPRVGFAYDVFGDGKMAIRGGAGIFYNRQSMAAWYKFFTAQAPLVQNPVIYYSELSKLAGISGFVFPSNVLAMNADNKMPAVYNYSLTIQRDVGFSTVVEAGYVGSVGRNLLWRRDINPVPMGANFDPANQDPTKPGKPLSASFLRPIPGYNQIPMVEAAASSNYHSLQVTARRRFTAGLQFGASWTWSRAMDFNDADTQTISALVDPRVWHYGPASFDRTHIFKLNYVWSVPEAPVSNPVLKQVLNGWRVTGITSFVSGAPMGISYSTTKAVDITGTASQGARVVLSGNPVLPKGDRTFSRYFDTSVVQMPAVGTIGNASKYPLRGPGINNWDVAIFKNFPVTEQFRLQFRAEMYNAFNHTQFSGVDTGARFNPATGEQVDPRFGEFTSARSPRIIQLSLRLYF